MKSTLSNICIFTVGAALGSAVTWKLLKTKYEQLSREEIDSVKEYYASRHDEKDAHEENCECENQEPEYTELSDVSELNDRLKENGYSSYNEIIEEMKTPYVIAPEEFGELESEGYDSITLYYYADKVLADENDELVEDVDNTVGIDSLTHFGEYEDDSVFVRNDRLKADYEILLSLKNYSEILYENPHPMEAE